MMTRRLLLELLAGSVATTIGTRTFFLPPSTGWLVKPLSDWSMRALRVGDRIVWYADGGVSLIRYSYYQERDIEENLSKIGRERLDAALKLRILGNPSLEEARIKSTGAYEGAFVLIDDASHDGPLTRQLEEAGGKQRLAETKEDLR